VVADVQGSISAASLGLTSTGPRALLAAGATAPAASRASEVPQLLAFSFIDGH
jgi:hypothetical protein